jgi:hypothetical protein
MNGSCVTTKHTKYTKCEPGNAERMRHRISSRWEQGITLFFVPFRVFRGSDYFSQVQTMTGSGLVPA